MRDERGMHRDGYLLRLGDRLPIAILLSLTLLAAGCTGNVFGGPTGANSAAAPPPAPAPAAAPANAQATPLSSLSSDVEGFFASSDANTQKPVAGAPQPDLDCPLIGIRSGASTLQIPPPSADENSTMSLKYQGTFVRAARDCTLVNKQMVMKIGVEGRIIVGPAGGPGEISVPLRIAVVDESPAGTKPIVTKFIPIPVTIGPGQEDVNFTHVEDAMSFPMPSADELDHYIVYIGFDPLAAEAQGKAREKPKRRVKKKVKPAASTD
jgi:hypothetical protein